MTTDKPPVLSETFESSLFKATFRCSPEYLALREKLNDLRFSVPTWDDMPPDLFREYVKINDDLAKLEFAGHLERVPL